MKKRFAKVLYFLLSFAVLVSLITVCALAAASGEHEPISGVMVSVSGATDNSMSDGKITVKAQGSAGIFGFGASAKTTTITIKNDGETSATISFEWSATNVSQLTIAGDSKTDTTGSFFKELDAEDTIVIKIVTGKNATENVLVLSGFRRVEAGAEYDVTLEYNNEFGSVTGNGNAILSGTTQSVGTTGIALKATPKSNCQFVAWVNAENNELLSVASDYTLNPDKEISVKAVFEKKAGTAWYMLRKPDEFSEQPSALSTRITYYTNVAVPGTKLYNGLNDAISACTSGDVIVLMNDATLPAGDYTIPAGVTLLIPFDSKNTMYTTQVQSTSTRTQPSAYRTLNMESGAKLILNGSMCVSAKQLYASGGIAQSCAPTGKYGCVSMEKESSIVVNGGGNLYVSGFITGSGSVTANNEATVYEMFQIADYRGGTKSTSMKHKVFPFSQYYVQNIEVPLTLYYGAVEYAFMTINVSALGQTITAFSSVSFIAPSDAMFSLKSGYFVKRYDGSTDRTILELYGNMEIAPIELEISITSIESKNYVLLLNGNLSIYIKEGNNVKINHDVALLPGAEVYIEKDASCVLGSGYRMYLYDVDQWGEYTTTSDKKFIQAYYAPGRTYTRTEADLKDAKIVVNGLADASAGYIYTTTGGADICSDGGGTVKVAAGTETVTYQLRQGADTYDSIPINTAYLKNADGSYVHSATDTYTYDSTIGKWICTNHTSVVDAAVDATCSATGLTEGSHCSACGEILVAQSEVPALDHTVVTDAAVAPTCTETGKTEGSHCSVCNEVLVAQKEVAALGHNYSEEVTSAPTCTEEGVLTFTCTACGDSYTEAVQSTGHNYVEGEVTLAPTCTATGVKVYTCHCGDSYEEVIDALGHSAVTDAAVAPTCTETGLTEGKRCSVCGEILVAQETVDALGHSYDSVVTEPTCTEAGYTTHTCSTCGDSYTDDEVAAKGHDYKSVVTEPTCTEAGYTTYTCACGESYISDEVAATGHSYGGWVVDGDTKTSTCGGCGEIAKRLVGEMNHLYSVQDVLYYNGSFDYSKDAKEIVFKDPQGNVLDTILCVQDSSGVIYLTYAMPSNVILDVVEFVIWIDGVQTDVFEINFDSYADTQTGTNYENVAQAIVDYGNASSTYFGKNEISEITAKYTSEPESGMSIKLNATESTSLDTYGASFVFDEYIAIKIYLSGNYTFKDGCTYQVGVLFGDETTSELNVNSIGNLCNAYVLYNTLEDVEISASDWVSPISAASADISKVPVLADKPGVQINLESVEYSKRFAIRAYLIECNADGNQTVYYGRQVNYGLEDYVCSMYNRTDEVLKTSYKVDNPKAFKQFLIETWNYAVAAKETKWAE